MTNPNNKMKTHYWICINPSSQCADLNSVAWTRSGSIKLAIKDISLNWRQVKYVGWKCIKQEINFSEHL